MHKRLVKFGIFFILLGIIEFSCETVYAFMIRYNDDINNSKYIVNTVDDNYIVFNNIAHCYEEKVKEIYLKFDLFLDEYLSVDKEIREDLIVLDDYINEIEISSDKLYNNCKYSINNKSFDAMCSSYKKNLVNIVDSYKELYEDYNSIINIYNEYATNKGLLKVNNAEININEKLLNIYNSVK